MTNELVKKEFDKIFPNHEQNLSNYKKYLTEKYGEEEVRKLEAVSSIVNESLSKMIDDLL